MLIKVKHIAFVQDVHTAAGESKQLQAFVAHLLTLDQHQVFKLVLIVALVAFVTGTKI